MQSLPLCSAGGDQLITAERSRLFDNRLHDLPTVRAAPPIFHHKDIFQEAVRPHMKVVVDDVKPGSGDLSALLLNIKKTKRSRLFSDVDHNILQFSRESGLE